MPETDQEVFEHFRSDYGDNLEIALLAYARYAQDKYDWVNHKLAHDGQAPSNDEIERWVSDLPNSRLAEIRNGAVSLFRDAAEEYMKPRIEEERAGAVESSILGRVDAAVRRVERATSFWRNIVPNVIVAVAASIVFSLVVLIGAAIYRGDPSIFALLKEPRSSTQPSTTRP